MPSNRIDHLPHGDRRLPGRGVLTHPLSWIKRLCSSVPQQTPFAGIGDGVDGGIFVSFGNCGKRGGIDSELSKGNFGTGFTGVGESDTCV